MLSSNPDMFNITRNWTLHSPKAVKNGHTPSCNMINSTKNGDSVKQQQEELDYTFVGRTGGDIFHEMMINHNITYVFGYPGGAILPVYDALHASDFVEIILPRHEQGAGHMAEGYAKATGQPAVVLVTSGPGATNTITALADAYADGVPIIVFSGQVALGSQGTKAFQEVDMLAISRTCTKWQTMVTDVADMPRLIDQAFEIAMEGRPGPVLVDLPKDVTSSVLKHPIPVRRSNCRTLTLSDDDDNDNDDDDLNSYNNNNHRRNSSNSSNSNNHNHSSNNNNADLIQQAARMINHAIRPVIFAGQGVFNNPDGPDILTRLAHQSNIPVTTTVHGLGAFDEKDPLALQMLGMHGSSTANMAIQHADVIIAIGARFDDRATMNVRGFAPQAIRAARQGTGGIIHFEIDPKHINLTVKSTLAILGDATDNVRRLLEHVDWMDRTSWMDQINGWKQQYPFYYKPALEDAPLKPQQLIDELEKQTAHLKHRLMITTGVGLHQMWAAQLLCWRSPRSMITSGSLGTMGYGVPSAIGAKLALPNHIVVDIDGDASFSMTAMELATAAQYNIGIKVLLLNNSFQAMVGQLQDMHYNHRYTATEMTNPDFIDFGKAVRVKAIRCTRTSEIPEKMAEFLAYDGPVLMEAVVDKQERLYPSVLAGNNLDQFVIHPDLRER